MGETRETSRPNYRANVIPLPVGVENIRLTFQVSNFRNRWGGMWNAPELGEASAVRASRDKSLLLEHLLCGVLMFMGVYHLVLFAYRPADRSPFYFAIFCLLFAVRTALMGERFWLDVFPNFNWEIAYKLEYLGYYLATPVWASFLRRAFPRDVPPWLEYVCWIIGLPITIITLVTPVYIYGGILFYKQFVTIFLGAYALYALLRAYLRRRQGALLFLSGWLILFTTVVVDFMHAAGLVDTPPLAPLGLALFALFQSLMLAGRFAGAFSAAEKISTELEYKVMERTRALKQARDIAEQSSHAKSDFLSVVSHEIRTPLNAVIGTADLLEEQSLNHEQHRLVGMLQRSGRVLLTLINEILDISRIESGKLELASVTFAPRDVIEGAAEMMRLRADQKGVSLTVETTPDVPEYLRGDPDRLHQVLVNLLGNAVKFTAKGYVNLSVESAGELELRFQVTDTGPGMPAYLKVDLFEPFAQADSSIRREFGGSGLGLAIVKRLVEMMNGEVNYKEHSEGGTVFEFTARFAAPAPGTEAAKTTARPVKTTPARGPRILIVEDNPDNQFLMQAFLAKIPGEVRVASDGAQAVEMVRQDSFDLILMDIQMPVMDGLTATRRIREWEQETGRDPLRILAVSANATQGDVEKSLAAGCDVHLTKPISRQKLLQAVHENMTAEKNPPGSDPAG